jgi:2-haloacid dehalogenase
MKRYEWLLFDADGTLFDYDQAEGIALRKVFRLHGLEFEPTHLTTYRQINHAAWQALEKGELTLSLLKVRRFELFLNALEIAHPPAAFSDT